MRIVVSLLLCFNIFIFAKECKLNYTKDIPSKAYFYLGYILYENHNTLPFYNIPHYFAALIEHESCITLCHKRCWDPKSRFKTDREEGAGLTQLTRVFHKDGRVKWDIVKSLKSKYKVELRELSWKNIYNRPDLQIKAMFLLWKENMNFFYNKVDDRELVWFLDSAYNGGIKYLIRERIKCKLSEGCDPDKWWYNVEKMNMRGNRKLYGRRTAYMINRHHVEDVNKRISKYYKKFFKHYLKDVFKYRYEIVKLKNGKIIH